MNAVRIGDSEPGEGKFKQAHEGEDIEGEMAVMRRGHWKNGGSCHQVRVDVECDPGALVGRVETFPGGEGGKPAAPNRGVLEGDNHGEGRE